MLVLLGDGGQPNNLMMTKNGYEWMLARIPLAMQGILAAPAGVEALIVFDEKFLYWLDLNKGSPQLLQVLPSGWKSVAVGKTGPTLMVVTQTNGLYYTPDFRQLPLQQIFQHTWVVDFIDKVQATNAGFVLLGSFYDRIQKQYSGAILVDTMLRYAGLQATAGYQESLFYDEFTVAGNRENLSPRAPLVLVSTRNNQPLGKLSTVNKVLFHASNRMNQHFLVLDTGTQSESWVSSNGGQSWEPVQPQIIGFPVTALVYDPSLRHFFVGNAYRFAMISENGNQATAPEAFSSQFQLAGGSYNVAVISR